MTAQYPYTIVITPKYSENIEQLIKRIPRPYFHRARKKIEHFFEVGGKVLYVPSIYRPLLPHILRPLNNSILYIVSPELAQLYLREARPLEQPKYILLDYPPITIRLASLITATLSGEARESKGGTKGKDVRKVGIMVVVDFIPELDKNEGVLLFHKQLEVEMKYADKRLRTVTLDLGKFIPINILKR